MTTPPPPGPYGQQGPYVPPPNQNQPNSQFGQQPPQGWGATPGHGFAQGQPTQGQFDGAQQGQHPGYPGYPGGPPKPKTGLIIGLVALGVLVVGGIVALIVVLTGKDDPAPSAAGTSSSRAEPTTTTTRKAPTRAPTPRTTQNPGGVPGGTSGIPVPGGSFGKPSPDELIKAIVQTFNSSDAANFGTLFCPLVKPSKLNSSIKLQVSSPVVSGTTATVKLPATQDGRSGTVQMSLKDVEGSWCLWHIG